MVDLHGSNFGFWILLRLRFLPGVARAAVLLAGAILSPCATSAEAGATATPASITALMERVADWQLEHPLAFDVFSQPPGSESWDLTRVGWDGSVLSRRPARARPEPTGLPAAWLRLARLERDDVSFCELPVAAQDAWRRETGFDPAAIRLIQMLDGSTRGWEMGVFYHGLWALAQRSDRAVYGEALRHLGRANGWQLGERVHHADDHVVGYLYLSLHERDRDPEQLAGVQSRFDWIRRHRPAQPMTIARGQDRWTWCDALFMAGPVWARLARVTRDPAYLDHLDAEWWAVVEHLYAPGQRLFFRDATFFDRREANGAPVFWSRGNGWVLAALARVLEELPADRVNRERYADLFRSMAERVVALQPADGLWRSSLLEVAAYPEPEVSGSALFCYALASGINGGFLERARYEPVVRRTWTALAAKVQSDGRLGYVQQPSAQPGRATEWSTAPYGVGAFLLAGAEVARLLERAPR